MDEDITDDDIRRALVLLINKGYSVDDIVKMIKFLRKEIDEGDNGNGGDVTE